MKKLATLFSAVAIAASTLAPFPEPLGPVYPQGKPDQSGEVAKWKKLAGKRLVKWRGEAIARVRDKGRYRVAIHRVLQGLDVTPLDRSFLCIHGYEGRWDDPNSPYWGGVQMDKSFMLHYGPEFYRWFGTADHWPAAVQIAVAIKAYMSGRGYGPWPNTARFCGLLR